MFSTTLTNVRPPIDDRTRWVAELSVCLATCLSWAWILEYTEVRSILTGRLDECTLCMRYRNSYTATVLKDFHHPIESASTYHSRMRRAAPGTSCTTPNEDTLNALACLSTASRTLVCAKVRVLRNVESVSLQYATRARHLSDIPALHRRGLPCSTSSPSDLHPVLRLLSGMSSDLQ